ncbi:MAG TPA: hypothetical protein VIH09_05700 [Flavobacterium sp.]|uniref:hypothetical protein n=1 Tax=Flavobacterium sp. TaxID=239 RepID=UPI002F404841
MEGKIKITFKNRNEITMGSPYNLAEIEISGIELNLPKFSWQDKYAISKNKKFITLVYFDFVENEPGFKIYIIDLEKGKSKSSKRLIGLLNKIEIENDTIKLNKFLYSKTKSEYGKLCCNFDEELKLEY